MLWLLVTVLAYFLNAVAAVIDKFLISKKIPQPVVYTFFIAILGIVAIILIPFGFEIPDKFIEIITSFGAGFSFVFALLYLFKALKLNDTTKITPLIGGLSPIFIFILSFIILSERLISKEILAFFILILGTILITLKLENGKKGGTSGFGLAVISAILFAISYVLTKLVYIYQPFISGFIWIRIGAFLTALLFLITPVNRQAIISSLKFFKPKQKKTGGLFLLGQASGAGSALLINYAIALASVSLVNALQGVQYVFLLAMALVLAKKYPYILEEKLTKKIFVQKILAIFLIVLGLFILSFKS